MQGEVDIHAFASAAEKVASVVVEEDQGFSPSASQAFNQIVDLAKRKQIPQKKVRELMLALAIYETGEGEDGESEVYDETFDMEKEVAEIIQSVRMLRRSIRSPNGKGLKAGVTVAEAKDVISMSNTMVNTLMKSHEKIVNMARYRAVEQATVDILRDLDGSEKLVSDLEEFHAAGKKGDGPLVVSFMEALESRLDK